MYIYGREFSGAGSLLRQQTITSQPAQRYSHQLNGISGDTSKLTTSRLRIGTYWANDFSKGCKDDDRLNHSDALALGFARAMAAQGHKWAVNHGSSHASPTDWLSFPDPKGTPFDNSDAVQGVDTTDFAYLATHGGVTYVDKPHPTPDLFVFRAGFGLNAPLVPSTAFQVESTSSTTWQRCIWFNNKSRLGDKNLRWLVVDACESLQLAGYVTGLKMNVDVNPAKMWHQVFHGLNMIFGFTGYSSDAWWTNQRGSNFGRRAGDAANWPVPGLMRPVPIGWQTSQWRRHVATTKPMP